MKLVIEVNSGPFMGRKQWLQARQMLHVGRTERADMAIPTDQLMSDVHFVVQADNDQCRVRDIGSHHGTFINSRRVKSAVLCDGDRICAGTTDFSISIDGVTTMTRAETSDRISALARIPELSLSPEDSVKYVEQTCESGLWKILGATPSVSPHDATRRLARIGSMYLIIDFNRLDCPIPENLVCPDYLINWVPEHAQEKYSPVVLGAPDDVDLSALLEEHWGKNCVIGVYSELDKPQVLARLRSAAGAFCHPGVLQAQLQTADPESASRLMSGINAVLLEQELSATWSLTCSKELAGVLQECGFVSANETTEKGA